MTSSFKSCASMLLMIQGADRSSFQTCGDTRFPGYLCFWEVTSIVLIVLSWTELVVTTGLGDKRSVELKILQILCLFVTFLELSFQGENYLPDITSLTLICH